MEVQQTTEANEKPKSPFVGLKPYFAKDAKFFFGRETETEIYSANLRSARLTVLYGTSGVGKSSVLQAGVVHHLRQLAAQDIKTYGQAEFAVVIYRDWAGDPLKGIARALREAIDESLGIKPDVSKESSASKPEVTEEDPETADFVQMLQNWSQHYGLELLIILDQFEELFNYLKDKTSPSAKFAEQLAKAVNAPDLSARFLISLRDDTLSSLDYFKESIPNLFNNRLQLYHLNPPKAYNAIKKPIEAYNDFCQPHETYDIEEELVKEVIEKTEVGKDNDETEKALLAEGVVQTPMVQDLDETYIETPYLQLVMNRIWREETEAGSRTLQLKTLTDKLGGTKQIIRTHLNETLAKFTSEERYIASKCFKYMVTPMRTKIAWTAAALAEKLERKEAEIKAVLEFLITGKPNEPKTLDISLPVEAQKAAIINEPPEKADILRKVDIPVGKGHLSGYEVSHDAYIRAILEWCERYEIEHTVINQIAWKIKKNRRYLIVAGMILLFLFLLGAYLNYLARRYNLIKEEELNAVNVNQNVRENKIEKEEANIAKITNLDIANLSNKLEDVEIAANKISEKETNYKELIGILLKLSDNSGAEKKSAIEDLKKLLEKRKVPKEYEQSIIQLVAKIDGNEANELSEIVKNTQDQKPEQEIKPRVFIHITNVSQNDRAESFREIFKRNDFIFQQIENVGNIKIINTQVRYFREIDKGLAEQVAGILQNENVRNIRVQFVSGYEDSTTMRPKHLEIWFSPDAFPNINQVAK